LTFAGDKNRFSLRQLVSSLQTVLRCGDLILAQEHYPQELTETAALEISNHGYLCVSLVEVTENGSDAQL
jgi:hypothetical protein